MVREHTAPTRLPLDGGRVGAGAADARAEGPTSISGVGYELWFIGAQRETIMNGKLAAALDLNTLAGRTRPKGGCRSASGGAEEIERASEPGADPAAGQTPALSAETPGRYPGAKVTNPTAVGTGPRGTLRARDHPGPRRPLF